MDYSSLKKDKFTMEYTGKIHSIGVRKTKYTMEIEKHFIDASKGNNNAKYINSSKILTLNSVGS